MSQHSKHHHIDTQLVNLGRDPLAQGGSVNPPVHRTSTLIFNNFAQMEAYESGRDTTLKGYGRNGTPSVTALENALKELEGAHATWVTPSGASACAIALLATLKSGDHMLMLDSVYGTTRKFCDHDLKRLGVEITYYDPAIGAEIASLMQPNTTVVYVESPGSQTFEMQDVPAIAKVAHEKGAIVIGDNTWGTPYYYKPFDLGVDISIHAATKYIGGHSDLLMGVISTNEKTTPLMKTTIHNIGAAPSGDNCYMALRGLRTMSVRMKQQQQSALRVAEWLQNRPEVDRMLCPFLKGEAGYDIWQRDFTGAASLFAFTLNASTTRDQVATFIDHLSLFGLGYSWGGFESLVTAYLPHSMRVATKDKWDKDTYCIRLHIGLEDADDLIADLEQALGKM